MTYLPGQQTSGFSWDSWFTRLTERVERNTFVNGSRNCESREPFTHISAAQQVHNLLYPSGQGGVAVFGRGKFPKDF